MTRIQTRHPQRARPPLGFVIEKRWDVPEVG